MDLKVYYPQVMLTASKDRKWEWFMCGKMYLDPELGVYVLELPVNQQFYDVESGQHYSVPKPPNGTNWKTKLVIAKYRDVELFKKAISRGLQGIAYIDDTTLKRCNANPLCSEAGFLFHPRALEKSRSIDNCKLIAYAKANYTCISRVIPTFPTPTQIDQMLKKNDCTHVCRVLYNYFYVDHRFAKMT